MSASKFASIMAVMLVVTPAGRSQTPPPGAAKISEVGKVGLTFDGKLTNDDARLVNVPLAELKGAPHQVHLVKLHKGQIYAIELLSSDFDSFLILQNALGKTLTHDDDSGGALNARIVHLAKSDGVYRVVVAALDQKLGMFQLKVRVSDLADATQQELAATASKLTGDAGQLVQQGKLPEALALMKQVLKIRQKLYPESKYPQGHADLASSMNNLGFLLQAMGRFEEALPFLEKSLAINRRQYPTGHPNLAVSLNNLGFILRAMGSPESALPYYEQALAMNEKLHPESQFPEGHPLVALGHNNLGALLQGLGEYDKARVSFERALAMQRRLYPADRYPDGHQEIARVQGHLALLFEEMGAPEQALAYAEQDLAMGRKLFPNSLFPDGHPAIADGLGNLGLILRSMGESHKAVPLFKQALEMYQRIYPEAKYPHGHPDVARSLNGLAGVQTALGDYEAALPLLEQSLAMKRSLYLSAADRRNHPEVHRGLYNLGSCLQAMGRYDDAFRQLEQAVAMQREIYPEVNFPEGHLIALLVLHNVGHLHQARGERDKAWASFQQAQAMARRLSQRVIQTASEAEALAFAQRLPPTRDALLDLALDESARTEAAYDVVWFSKAAVTRVLEQRHAAARVAGTALAPKLARLKGVRRRIDQLVQDQRLPPRERDALLTAISDERDALERELARNLPMLAQAQELNALGSKALSAALPEEAALIDVVRYTPTHFDPAKPGKAGQTQVPAYAAFVVAPGKPPRRVELGPAAPVDQAVAKWRLAIATRRDDAEADAVGKLVWAKLRPQIPAETKTLYVAADGDLAHLPWAALPTAPGRVLLEDYAVAQAPHGVFLLAALKYGRDPTGPEAALLLGDVAYQSPTWPTLHGAAQEVKTLAVLAARTPMTLTKTDATAQQLTALLPKARYAHLATHGYFDAEALRLEQRRAQAAAHERTSGDTTRRIASKNPLAFAGLVLAQGDVFTGLNVVDLSLEQLAVVTLSACETGLGDYTAGEGVQGLQRAFHIAGCPNVVASLWKVNDAATAALMAKFYHEMWVNKKPPLEALREAQLTIYRHPELIPVLAGERGAPRLKEAVAVQAGTPPTGDRGRAHTKLWAAFVLSGAGR